MSKSLKDANWGVGGCGCILVSILILVMYLLKGGFYNREGKFFKLDVECAVLMFALFFLMGIICLAASIALRSKRKSRPPDISRWRRRSR